MSNAKALEEIADLLRPLVIKAGKSCYRVDKYVEFAPGHEAGKIIHGIHKILIEECILEEFPRS